MGRTIEDINVVDVEKRKIPSKHYVSDSFSLYGNDLIAKFMKLDLHD